MNKNNDEIKTFIKVDGVMIGDDLSFSYFFKEIEKEIFNNKNVPSEYGKLIQHIQEQAAKGVQLNHIMDILWLFHGQNGSKIWKQYLSKNMCRDVM